VTQNAVISTNQSISSNGILDKTDSQSLKLSISTSTTTTKLLIPFRCHTREAASSVKTVPVTMLALSRRRRGSVADEWHRSVTLIRYIRQVRRAYRDGHVDSTVTWRRDHWSVNEFVTLSSHYAHTKHSWTLAS